MSLPIQGPVGISTFTTETGKKDQVYYDLEN